MRIKLLSDAKVARRCASCGEAASLSKGGAGVRADADDFEGEEAVGDDATRSQLRNGLTLDICIPLSDFSAGSYMIVECSKLLKSNMRTLPSAPQDTNTSTEPAQKRTSNTSLSCAMSCVLAVNVGISQIVHVVSIEDVMMSFGESVFQSSDVRGAVCSGVLLFDNKAKGCNFCGACSLVFAAALRLRLLLGAGVEDCGKLHNRKWSPLVANRSVLCFCELGGSHSIRVTGYAHVASATFVYSKPYGADPCDVTS